MCRKYVEARKAFQFAHTLDPSNIQIVIDLSDLQVQTRDYAGFYTSRNKLLQQRSGNTAFWLGFVVGAFLTKSYDTCIDIITTFRKGTPCTPSYITQELYFIEAECHAQKKEFTAAAEVIQSGMPFILDEDKARQKEALYRGYAGDLKGSEALWERLMEQNSDDLLTIRGLEGCVLGSIEGIETPEKTTDWTHEERTKLRGLYDRLMGRFPGSLVLRHRHLRLLEGAEFEKEFELELLRAVRKGIPSFFRSVRDLLRDPAKFSAAKSIAERLLARTASVDAAAEANAAESAAESALGEPQTRLWLCLFLAEVADAEKRWEEALEYLDRAYEHTPTCYDLYLLKARVEKHRGALRSAAETIGKGSGLDRGDRFLNTKHVKYLLRAGEIEEADRIVAYWTRKDVPCRIDLDLLQACWFEVECAEAYEKRGDWPHALKLFVAVLKHFECFVEDQFDFHQYVLRKGILTTYIDFLHKVDTICNHPYYFRAAKGAIRVVLRLAKHPVDIAEYSKTHTLTPKYVHKKGAEFQDDQDPDGLKLVATEQPLDLVKDVITELMLYAKNDADAMMLVAQWAEMKNDSKVYQEAVQSAPCIEAWLKMDKEKTDMSQYHSHVMIASQMSHKELKDTSIGDILIDGAENGDLEDCIRAFYLLKQGESERLQEFVKAVENKFGGLKELLDLCVCLRINSMELRNSD